MEVSFNTKVKVPENILIREIRGESVLLNLNNKYYFGLDKVGTRMWNVLAKADTIQGAYEALLGKYEVDGDALKKDLQSLVGKLVANGLLEVAVE